MSIKNTLLIISVCILLLSGCYTQRNYNKQFLGFSKTEIINQYGKPDQVIPGKNGKETFVYQKSEKIKAAVINKGDPSLDKLESASATKTEKYFFYFNEEGQIIDVKHKTEYSK